jgi:oligopeptide/dipeptide ABC transporter ATP-binding protein
MTPSSPGAVALRSAGGSAAPLLSVRDLHIGLVRHRQAAEIVRGVDLEVAAGEKLGIVGESGSGKTLTVLSVLRLLPEPVRILRGSAFFDGKDLAQLNEKDLQKVRGAQVAMVYQDPMTSLNPLLRVGTQIVEALRAHGSSKQSARERCIEVLAQVGLPDPPRVDRSFPHQLSGGMAQRAMIAMALSTSPRLLIADEPTTALDVTIQQQILELVEEIQANSAMAVIWVTHDLGVVARLVDRVVVMYAGRVVERALARELFYRPAHPYTLGLLGSLPSPTSKHREVLAQIEGSPPDPTRLERGCPYRERCPFSYERCREQEPPLLDRGAGSWAACWREPSEWRK